MPLTLAQFSLLIISLPVNRCDTLVLPLYHVIATGQAAVACRGARFDGRHGAAVGARLVPSSHRFVRVQRKVCELGRLVRLLVDDAAAAVHIDHVVVVLLAVVVHICIVAVANGEQVLVADAIVEIAVRDDVLELIVYAAQAIAGPRVNVLLVDGVDNGADRGFGQRVVVLDLAVLCVCVVCGPRCVTGTNKLGKQKIR